MNQISWVGKKTNEIIQHEIGEETNIPHLDEEIALINNIFEGKVIGKQVGDALKLPVSRSDAVDKSNRILTAEECSNQH